MKQARIDSKNLASPDLYNIFNYNEDYTIEDVKSRLAFQPERWQQEFGKMPRKNEVECSILHTSSGLALPIKTIASSKQYQTLELAGIQRFDERSELLKVFFIENQSALKECLIRRLDVCIDFEYYPKGATKKLSKKREPRQYKNSIYFKTKKEKKTNRYVNVLLYDKTVKDGSPLRWRLEFSFRSGYVKGYRVKDLESLFKKMEESILKLSGLSVKIQPISLHA